MNNQIKILGNKIDCFRSYQALYERVADTLLTNRAGAHYVTVNNVHTMVEGFWDPTYRMIINGGYLSIPDGKPLEILGKLKGNRNISRLFGPSVMEKFIDWGRKDGLTHFFFGSSEANLDKLKKAIESKYPGTRIVGMLSPPYLPMDQWDNETFIRRINNVQPDIIWVGLGAPKQERWMYEQYGKIDRGILFGIGAGFDYLSGNTRHAPKWMKNFALEWVFRLMQEPRRLWKRYFKTIPQFVFLAFFELLGIKFRESKKVLS